MFKRGVALMGLSAVAGGGFAAAQELGTVLREQKVASGTGGFAGVLDQQDHFGRALAALGDLDGDGVGDLAVGVPEDDDGGTNRGAVWVLFLEPQGTVRSHAKISGTQGGFAGTLANTDHFGSAVVALGDLDGDGLREIAVGADEDDDGVLNNGAVWILSLGPDGRVANTTKISQTGGGFTGVLGDSGRFGRALAALGDMDGDGVGELAVGANLDSDEGLRRGAVWVLFLDELGFVKTQTRISSAHGGFAGPLDDSDRFGTALAALGDLDGDGVEDLAVGADQDDDGGDNHGAVWILFLQPDGSVRDQVKLSAASGLPIGDDDRFGASVAAPGDVDGDGTPDLMVGATLTDHGGANRGAVWVLFMERDGSAREWRTISATTGGFAGPLANSTFFGMSLAPLGDLDGDQMLDFAVGGEGDDTGGSDRGALWTLFLETAIPPPPPVLVVRNGAGVNPLLLSAEAPPVVGSLWEVHVDCTGFHAGLILHAAVDTPAEGPVHAWLGQRLIDWCRPRFLARLVKHRGAPTSVFHDVPADPALVGRAFYSQAFVTGRCRARFTNALDGEFRPLAK